MSKTLRVVVYTPTFNRSAWLADCMESVASQDYQHKVHFIVDDCSTDDTFEEVSSIIGAKPQQAPDGASRFSGGSLKGSPVWIATLKQNTGPAGARNWAARVASPHADVFGNLDSDDRYRPGYLSKMIEPFRHGEIGAVYCDYEVINHDTRTVVREFKEPFSRKRLFEDCLLCNDSLVRKTAFEQIGGYDPNLRVAEDWDLWLRLSEKNLIYHIPECLLELHAGLHGSAKTVPAEQWQRDRAIVARKAAARDIKGRT